MHAKINNPQMVSFRFATSAALFAGLFGLLLLILPDMDFIAFLLSASGIGLLFAGDKYYTEPDQQRIRRSVETAFQWLFLVILCAYALIALFNWLHIGSAVVSFAALHWPALVALSMCSLAGGAGLRNTTV